MSTDTPFACPKCRQPLSPPGRDALLTCSCGATYPHLRGVRRFVDAEHYSGSFGYQWNHFSRTQLDSANGSTRSRDAFVERTCWSTGELRGKRILDAGCGMGRFAEVCADAGAGLEIVVLTRATKGQRVGARGATRGGACLRNWERWRAGRTEAQQHQSG